MLQNIFVGVNEMKRRIRELVAIFLTVCMVFGSIGIESRASYGGSPANSASINTEQGWLNYTNLWTYQNHTYTHYGWYGYFQSLSEYGNQIYSINDEIPVNSDGNKLVPSSNTENEFISIWTSKEVYRIAATDSNVDYIVGSTPTTGSSNQYIDVPAESSVQVKGDLYKAAGFRDGVTGDTFLIDVLSESAPDGVEQITAENNAEVCIGTYDLQPDIRRYVTASYEMGAGDIVDGAEFTADEQGSGVLTLSRLTDGKGTAPEGYTLDHWEYYIGTSEITDSIDLLSTSYDKTQTITCKAFWKPVSGYDIMFNNTSTQDVELKINESETQEIKTNGTASIYGVSTLSGWSTDGLYQITSWYGYDGNSTSFTNNNAVLDLTSSTDENIQAVLNEVSYDANSHLPIMNGYISPGSGALKRALTLSFDPNAGVESGQIVNVTDAELDLSKYLPASGPNKREGLTFDRWTYFLTDSNTDREDQKIEDGILAPNDVSDYKTVRITPIYTGTVTFVDESSSESFEPMKEDEGTPIYLYDLSELRDGYTFVGWSETKGSTTAEYDPGSSYTITKDTTLYAVWKINTYNLIWKDYSDGVDFEPQTYSEEVLKYDSIIALPSDPVKEGYTFLGWSGYGSVYWDGDMSGMYKYGDKFSYTMPADDAKMSAYWEINSYAVTYDGNGTSTGVPTGSEEVTYHDTVTVSSMEPVRSGYVFSGWSDGTTVYSPGETFQMPASDVTLTAQWTPNQHNVIYDGNGASSGVPDSQKADYNSSVTVGEEPIKDGYKFVGWEQISTGNTINAGGTFLMPDMDETLKAKWQIAYSRMGKGTFYLIKGQNYSMGGTLKVSGDNSVYSSGITFYVPASGNYTFE